MLTCGNNQLVCHADWSFPACSDFWPHQLNHNFIIYVYTFIVGVLFLGPQDRPHNFALTAFWGYWWPGIFLVYPFLGRIWCSSKLFTSLLCHHSLYLSLLLLLLLSDICLTPTQSCNARIWSLWDCLCPRHLQFH